MTDGLQSFSITAWYSLLVLLFARMELCCRQQLLHDMLVCTNHIMYAVLPESLYNQPGGFKVVQWL